MYYLYRGHIHPFLLFLLRWTLCRTWQNCNCSVEKLISVSFLLNQKLPDAGQVYADAVHLTLTVLQYNNRNYYFLCLHSHGNFHGDLPCCTTKCGFIYLTNYSCFFKVVWRCNGLHLLRKGMFSIIYSSAMRHSLGINDIWMPIIRTSLGTTQPH